MPRLSRVFLIIAVLSITADAGLCPFLCLAGDIAAPESSNVPPPPTQCGGVCSVALDAPTVDARWQPTGNTAPVVPPLVMQFGLAPTFDIDHPPRLS